jgi:NADH-quinone oxidoreductase subunit H
LFSGSLSLVAIMNQQVSEGWFLFSPPGLVSFVILLIASIAEVNRTPFDLPEAESEIIAGFHTEYSSMRFGLFFLAEYMSVFAVSCLATILFLGGGALPFTDFPKGLLGGSLFAQVIFNLFTIGVFALKVGLFIFVFFWVRATLPRMRVDRLMNFAWKFLVPLSILNIPIAAIWFELVLNPSVVHEHWLFLDLTWWAGVVVTGVLELLAIGLCRFALRADAEATSKRIGTPRVVPVGATTTSI